MLAGRFLYSMLRVSGGERTVLHVLSVLLERSYNQQPRLLHIKTQQLRLLVRIKPISVT